MKERSMSIVVTTMHENVVKSNCHVDSQTGDENSMSDAAACTSRLDKDTDEGCEGILAPPSLVP